ncbi:MAG TPA: phosphotransferase [Acidimicrobiales bacterium]
MLDGVTGEATVDYPADAGLRAVLRSLGVPPGALLGHGGEAWVYALDGERVARVLHEGTTLAGAGIADRQALVDELALRGAPFALPQVLDVREVEGRVVVTERRLPGRSVLELLAHAEGHERDLLVEAYLDAAAALGALHLEPRPWWGELIGRAPLRAPAWPGYLERRAEASLAAAGGGFARVDAGALADALPDASAPAFVHLDAFAGNVLAAGSTITAVIDVGVTSVVGDARLDPVSAVVYLSSAEITPVATPRDVDVAEAWLRAAGLDALLEPARRWLAAYWAFAADDVTLHRWCRSTLLE